MTSPTKDLPIRIMVRNMRPDFRKQVVRAALDHNRKPPHAPARIKLNQLLGSMITDGADSVIETKVERVVEEGTASVTPGAIEAARVGEVGCSQRTLKRTRGWKRKRGRTRSADSRSVR